jgi:hypothetical protein
MRFNISSFYIFTRFLYHIEYYSDSNLIVCVNDYIVSNCDVKVCKIVFVIRSSFLTLKREMNFGDRMHYLDTIV